MNFSEKYRHYVKRTPPGLWFRRKVFGWGWTPTTWQGWVLTLVYVALISLIAFSVRGSYSPRETGFALLFIVILTVMYIRIVYKKGERPLRWQWGFPEEN